MFGFPALPVRSLLHDESRNGPGCRLLPGPALVGAGVSNPGGMTSRSVQEVPARRYLSENCIWCRVDHQTSGYRRAGSLADFCYPEPAFWEKFYRQS